MESRRYGKSDESNELIPGGVPPEGEEVVCAEYDSGWKEAIEQYFTEFLSFFFPAAYAEVDLRGCKQSCSSL
ncbi:MAG: hypothetical protein AB1611_02500 [bacterium]